MSIIAFDINDLHKVVAEAAQKSGARFNKEDFTKTSYLPEGTHTVSFFFDPDKHIFRDIAFHKPQGSRFKSHCPNRLNEEHKRDPKWPEFVQSLSPDYAAKKLTALPPCRICELNTELQEIDKERYGDPKKGKAWKLRLGVDRKSLMYLNLYETSNAGEYWTPDAKKGTPYAVIATKKLKDTFIKMLETYSANPAAGAYVVKALNPTVPSPPFTIINTGGPQGTVNITVIPQDEKAAIIESESNPPTWWRPLSQVFIKKEFNLEDYEANVKTAEDLVAQYRSENVGTNYSYTDEVSSKRSDGGSVESFLASKGVTDVKVPENVKTSDLVIRDSVAAPKELTPVEKEMEDTGELAPNQRMTKMGEVVTLPDFAVERDCWTNFASLDPLCMKCPYALECSFEM